MDKKMTQVKPVCGLCRKSKKLYKTSCCDNWICDDEDNYVLFSFARNSCHRNHDHYTICAFHYHEDHKGDWKTCEKCKNSFDTEDFVWMATNEYNFEKLPNPPSYKPTHCSECHKIIIHSEDGYTLVPDGRILCEVCGQKELNKQVKSIQKNN